MESKSQAAMVYYQGKKCGILQKTDHGYEFTYDPEYLSAQGSSPISLSLPLRAEKYFSPVLFPFFEGLLPEGWLLDLATKTFKMNKNDQFGLLLKMGADTVGAVSLKPFAEQVHE